MNSKSNTSDAETERAGTREDSREADLPNPTKLKRAFQFLVLGLNIWRAAAKLWEWFL